MEELEKRAVELAEVAIAAEKKLAKTPDPVEIYRRNVRTMSNRQLSSHLRRKKRNAGLGMDSIWATVGSIVFDNTESTGVGGKLMPYLR